MLAGVVLLVLVVNAALMRRWGRPGAASLVLVSLLWLVVNGPMEGPTLLTVTSSHGLTAGDLAGLAGLALAAWGLLRPAPASLR